MCVLQDRVNRPKETVPLQQMSGMLCWPCFYLGSHLECGYMLRACSKDLLIVGNTKGQERSSSELAAIVSVKFPSIARS